MLADLANLIRIWGGRDIQWDGSSRPQSQVQHARESNMANSLDNTQSSAAESIDALELRLHGLAMTAGILADVLDRYVAPLPDNVLGAYEKEKMAYLWNEVVAKAGALAKCS
jgi:hypothetical protein